MEGLRELEAALAELPKATAKATLRRTLKKAAQPIADGAQGIAPKLTGQLQRSIIIGTRLTRRQAREARREGKHFAEIHVGTADPAGVPQEFGTFKENAQPFMRPSWDGNKDEALRIIGKELGNEIEKSAARLSRKAARLAAKG